MLSIDREREKIRRRDHLIHQLQLLVIALGLIVIVLAAMIYAMTTTAASSSICLSYRQARQLWPKQHIWWYSKDHCWSNRRGGPPRNLKFDPVFSRAHAESLPAAASVAAGKADRAAENPRTVRTIPITKPTAWKNDFEDYCCWPPMEEALDIDRERERAFRILAEKFKAK